MANSTLQLAHGTLTRVGYLDVPIPAEFVGLNEGMVKDVAWGEPTWSDAGQIRFGAATWIADINDTRIALDPIMAADAFLRATPETEMEQQKVINDNFKKAGYPVESVDIVLLTHFDGVGAVGLHAEDGSWSPFFPNAKILISEAVLDGVTNPVEIKDLSAEDAAFAALIAAGHIHTFADAEEVQPGITADVSGAHGVGHTVFHFALEGDAVSAAFIGHLAVSPLHLLAGPCEGLHADPVAADKVLHGIATSDRTLIGPLWPTPGYGTWTEGRLIPGV